MKSINIYIKEALKLGKRRYNYHPKTKEELQKIINKRVKEEGNECNLNDIDVSYITDMSYLFEGIHFNGDISKWDVSNVKDMKYMFYWCGSFNKDISKWDVSSVKYMQCMFLGCVNFNQDLSVWDVSNVTTFINTFLHCKIEENYKPKFK